MAGSWSSWTEWATCRRPCRKPTLRRKRVCDNPAPQGKGELCERHDGMKFSRGSGGTKSTNYFITQHPGRRDEEELVAAEADRMPDDCQSGVVSSQFDKKCSCGCAITIQNQGQIVSSLDNDCLNTMTSVGNFTVHFLPGINQRARKLIRLFRMNRYKFDYFVTDMDRERAGGKGDQVRTERRPTRS